MGGGVVRSERSFFPEKFYSGRNISENHVRFEYYFFLKNSKMNEFCRKYI